MDLEILIDKHSGVIYGALKVCGVRRHFSNYDDFVQSAYIGFIKAFDAFGDVSEENEKLFCSYAFTHTKWEIIRFGKAEARNRERHSLYTDESLMALGDEPIDLFSPLMAEAEQTALYEELIGLGLSQQERWILDEHLILGIALKTIAEKRGISPVTASRWKARLLKKIRVNMS
jgi:RNA polymerase sigma factor (sigma-70 family)